MTTTSGVIALTVNPRPPGMGPQAFVQPHGVLFRPAPDTVEDFTFQVTNTGDATATFNMVPVCVGPAFNTSAGVPPLNGCEADPTSILLNANGGTDLVTVHIRTAGGGLGSSQIQLFAQPGGPLGSDQGYVDVETVRPPLVVPANQVDTPDPGTPQVATFTVTNPAGNPQYSYAPSVACSGQALATSCVLSKTDTLTLNGGASQNISVSYTAGILSSTGTIALTLTQWNNPKVRGIAIRDVRVKGPVPGVVAATRTVIVSPYTPNRTVRYNVTNVGNSIGSFFVSLPTQCNVDPFPTGCTLSSIYLQNMNVLETRPVDVSFTSGSPNKSGDLAVTAVVDGNPQRSAFDIATVITGNGTVSVTPDGAFVQRPVSTQLFTESLQLQNLTGTSQQFNVSVSCPAAPAVVTNCSVSPNPTPPVPSNGPLQGLTVSYQTVGITFSSALIQPTAIGCGRRTPGAPCRASNSATTRANSSSRANTPSRGSESATWILFDMIPR